MTTNDTPQPRLPVSAKDAINDILDSIAATGDLLCFIDAEDALGRLSVETLPAVGRRLEADAQRIRDLIQS